MRQTLRSVLVRLALVLAPLCAVVATPTPAVAQFGMGMGGMGGGNVDPITRRGVKTYAAILGMDASQLETAMTLLDGYQQTTRAVTKGFQEEMQSGELMGDPQAMQKKVKELQQKLEGDEKQFFDDLKLLLTPEQAEKWPKLERHRRREKLMRFGMVSGAGVDLVQVVERTKAKPADSAEFGEVLDRYELDLDKMLVSMESEARKAQDDMMTGGNMFDMEKVNKMLQTLAESAKKVREANKDTYRKLSPLVPEDRKAAFEEEFNRRSFPQIYRQQGAAKLFDAAMKLEDLDAAQKDSLAAAKDGYLKELVQANQRLATVTERVEDEKGGTIGMMMMGMTGQGPDPDLKDAKEARKTLDTTTREKVMAILTEAQRAKMPEIKAERENPFGAMQEMMKDMEEESQEK